MRARILRVTLATIILMAVFLPVGAASAASRATITEKEALKYCKSWIAEFNEKENWQKYKKGRRCAKIKWSNPSGQSSPQVICNNTRGEASTKENGKWNCSWGYGFKKEKNTNDSADDNVGGDEKADVEIVVGAGKSDGKCVGSALIYTKKVGDKKYFCDESGSGAYEIILIVFNIFSAVVGVLGVLGLVISGITYLTARDNEQQVAKAKKRIVQILIGLGIYAALYLLLQWIIPGGIFGG